MTQPSALIAFHGKPEIKAQCIARLEADLAANHRNLDAWRNADELGIPKWLCHCAEQIEQRSRTWSRDFLQAMPIGSDLDAIKGPFLIFVLGCAHGIVEANHADVLAAVDRSIALWERPDIHSDGWLNEASAAEAAASEAAGAAKTRPSWRAALAAASAAKAAERPHAVVEVMEHAFSAATRAWEVARAAMRAQDAAGVVLPKYDYRDFSDELLRLVKTEGRIKRSGDGAADRRHLVPKYLRFSLSFKARS